jgi:hypothetical protein
MTTARARRWLEITGFSIAALAGAVLPAAARAGGGSNGGGGGGILTLILLPFFLAYAWWKGKKIKEKNARSEALLAKLARLDPIWNEDRVIGEASRIFLAVQKAWVEQDLPRLRELMAPEQYGVWEKEVMSLQEKGWTNRMDRLTIASVRVVEVRNYRDDAKDSFTACVDAAAEDYTVDRAGTIVESNASDGDKRAAKQKSFDAFTEFWTFARRGDGWRVSGVDQDGQWSRSVNAPLVDEDGA